MVWLPEWRCCICWRGGWESSLTRTWHALQRGKLKDIPFPLYLAVGMSDEIAKKTAWKKKVYDLDAWRDHHVRQLAYARNIILALALATFGFVVTLLVDINENKLSEILLKVGASCFLISIALGLVVAILESRNYRLKYRIARSLEKEGAAWDDKNERDECSCTFLEGWNRVLLPTQIAFFTIGLVSLACTIL